MTFLIGLLITLSKGYDHAEVIMVSNKDILIAAFLNALFCIGAGVVGSIAYWRSYRHRHIMMVVYTFLLWLCLAMITTIGYLAYNNTALNLKTKLGMKWRYDLTAEQHMVLQTNLRCCGFENPADHATYSAHCWPESLLPGCQNRLYNFQYNFLVKTYTMCFALLPVHVLATLSALYVFHDSKVEEPSYPPDMTDEDPTKVDTPAINFEHPACPACKNWTF
ncbi:uncharacterized protein BYT42DRAFT_581329 [Radiomyces spectabilis]|uniref:uncharacterized protein n=1 Tax=Radiomyces spectabilis TaxID=64574 RepID=UPI00221FBEE5|nr:uncharacterized protein BYT42DRAFT_581329 [Radiomyces spectabilis]KAI8371739.1 hypothetical protein BYT42DRAFT_581329 [Radiomyces spectabilis]